MEELNNALVQFQWGIKRGVGGTKKDVRFYESFTFDGVHYALYDNVYLFKTDENEPYIGKIIKIWEQGDGKKKVKILWFFEPGDIFNYLGDYKPMEKEIFLASGEGIGLANINPLEAISAKCSVICTSDDSRNLQPSKHAVDGAEHIFCHMFDVGNLTISEKLPDKIAGIEVKYLLNREDDLHVAEANHLVADGADERVPSLKLKADGADERVPSLKLKADGADERVPSLKLKADGANERVPSLKLKAEADISNDKPAKKMRLGDDSERKQLREEKLESPNESLQKTHPAASWKNTTEADHQIKMTQKPEVRSSLHRDALEENTTEAEKQIVATQKPNVVRPPIHHDALVKNTTEAENQMVVARKPDADRSKWFKGLPWKDRLQKANQLGTLMLLQNFDRALTSRDIEDTIYDIFNHSCTAKVIPLLPPYHNPHHGQAYVIFKTQDAADEAIHKINKGCLMLQNRSALVATKGMLKMPEKPKTLIGHFQINKIQQRQREEMRKAVSTSHCSQPNTIEYEMAMEWILLQEKTITCFNQLYKWHGDDGNKATKHPKSSHK